MYICVTHVDHVSRIPCTERPMFSGPDFPSVKGLNIEWWDESYWPTDFPKFYGTCDDDAEVNISGVLEILDENRYNELKDFEINRRFPQVISARQARLTLLKNGLLSQVESTIENLEEPIRSVVKIEWEFATTFDRNHHSVKILMQALGLSDDEIKNLFLEASKIDTIPPQHYQLS